MKNQLQLKSFVGGALVASAVLLSIGAAVKNPSETEYKTLHTRSGVDLEQRLNALAEQGWEVVTSSTTYATGANQFDVLVILKKSKR